MTGSTSVTKEEAGSIRTQQPLIRTPDQRLRVFVSSTLKEMEAERAAAREAVSSLRLAPIMFELGARPYAAQTLYRAYLQQSHIFLGIYGEQYGWVGPDMTVSGLEDEYRRAAGMPKLIYVKADGANRDPRLKALLGDIRERGDVSYKYFSSVDELRGLIVGDLAVLLAESFETRQASLASPGDETGALPQPLTTLVGRARELEAARELVLDPSVRLVTLTGASGSGKTRLGVELARQLSEKLERAYFVELETLREPDLMVATIARAVGVREAGAEPLGARLKAHLRGRRALLLLDNFEQVVAAAPYVTELLESCPLLKVLVTSRMPLHVRGEFEFPVPPLEVPDAEDAAEARDLAHNAAVRLFVERSRAVKPGFAATEENAPTLVEICRRLEGLPLAIELAAARMKVLSPEAILKRLEQKLVLLQGGARDLPERQQTIRNAIAWSYDLLDTEEARLFRQLAVFAGGWTLEAAEAVCARGEKAAPKVEDLLAALASKNLIRAQDAPGGEPRFSMFESVREYASEQLWASEEDRELFAGHAAFYVRLAEKAEPHLTSGRREPWLTALSTELGNLRAVLERSSNRLIEPGYGIRLAGTLGWFWHLRGHLAEGRSRVTALLNLPEASTRSRARGKLLFPAGGLAWSQGDHPKAIGYLEESASILEEVGDLRGLTDARGILAGSLAGIGSYDRAQALCEEMEARLRQADDRWGLAFTLYWLGGILLARADDAAPARKLFEEILAISEDVSDGWLRAEALDHLGVVAGMQDEYEEARAYFEQSLAHHRAFGDDWATARALSEHGEAALRAGRLHTAEEVFREALRMWREVSNTLGILVCLGGLARVAAESGHAERAARLFGAAPRLVRAVGWLFVCGDVEEYERHRTLAREMLSKEAWRKAYEEGRALTREEAVGYALSSGGTAAA